MSDTTKRKNVRLPSKGLYSLGISALRPRAKNRLHAKIDKSEIKDIKPPYVVLSNHCSVNDWFIVGSAMYPERLNVVITRHFYSNPALEPWLWRIGAIPKNQFAPDVGTIKDILSAAKQGGNVMLFPEGRTSPHGRTETIEKSTVKLLKKLKLPVVYVHMDGAYFSRPKWSKKDRLGRVDVKVRQMFTAEELKTMSDDELYERMMKLLPTDEFAWQAKNHVKFSGKNFAEGLENLLYMCPKCGGILTTRTDGDTIFCEKCGNGTKLNNYYEFEPLDPDCVIPENIADWYDLQKEKEREKIISDPDFKMEGHVVLRRPYRKRGEWLSPVGEGTLTVSRDGVLYEGTQDGEKFTLHSAIAAQPAMVFGCAEHVALSKDGEYYSFVPDNLQECIRWALVEEVIHYLEAEKTEENA